MELFSIQYSYEADKYTQILIEGVYIVQEDEKRLYYIRKNAVRPEEVLFIEKDRVTNLKRTKIGE